MVVNVIRLFVDVGESSGVSLVTQSVQDSSRPNSSVYKNLQGHWLDRYPIKKAKTPLRTSLLRKEGEFIFWVVDREIWGTRAGTANRG